MSSPGREGCHELGIGEFLALGIGVSALCSYLPLDFGFYSIDRHGYRQDPVAISFGSRQALGSLRVDHDYPDQSFSGLDLVQKVPVAKALHPSGCFLALCPHCTCPVDDHEKDCLMNGREDNQGENLDCFLRHGVVPGNQVAVFFYYDSHLVGRNCLVVNSRAFPYALPLSTQDHLARVRVPAMVHHVEGLFLEVLVLVHPINLHLSLVHPSWIQVHVVMVLVQDHPLMVQALPYIVQVHL